MTEVVNSSAEVFTLLVDEDSPARSALSEALKSRGYEVATIGTAASALDFVEDWWPDLMIIDDALPDVDGKCLCRRLRAEGVEVPIMLIGNRTNSGRTNGSFDADPVSDCGADQILSKPFELDDLLSRLSGLVGLDPAYPEEKPIRIGHVRLDRSLRRAWRGTNELELTKTEFNLLELFCTNAGKVMKHRELQDAVWGPRLRGRSKNLAVYVGYLRRKLEAGGEQRLIHTVRGVGYIFRT
jgi:two-component system, OmpR family, response regulator MprA